MIELTNQFVAGEIDLGEAQPRALRIADAVVLRTGARLGRYQLGTPRSIGHDADVWEAVDHRGRPVMIKVAARPTARFDRDALELCGLGHPNLVAVLADGELLDGRAYVVFERVDGVQLRRWLGRGRFGLAAVGSILTQLGRALAGAHARGLVHGQITPEHVMICAGDPVRYPHGQVKLVGLGTTLGAGNPAYRATEQLTRAAITTSADLFALGAIAVELLTGRGPFYCSSLRDDRRVERRSMPAKIELRSKLAYLHPVLCRALAEAPAERWATVGELVEAVTGEPLAPLARGSASLICPSSDC